MQLSKLIQNPSYLDLQKAANQGRRCTWEKLSAIKANCAIELQLDECVALLNHMRRLKRSAERAAAFHGSANLVRFSASKRIPSWNCIARENSAGSLEEEALVEAATAHHQGTSYTSGASNRGSSSYRSMHDSSDSESDTADLHSWTRSGGPLMRTASANKFINFVQNLDVDADLRTWSGEDDAEGSAVHCSNFVGGRDTHNSTLKAMTADRSSDNTDSESRESSNRGSLNSNSRILVSEGDLLQPERCQNGIVFNVVRKEDYGHAPRNSETGQENVLLPEQVAECMQIDSCNASAASDYDDDEHADPMLNEEATSSNWDGNPRQSIADGTVNNVSYTGEGVQHIRDPVLDSS